MTPVLSLAPPLQRELLRQELDVSGIAVRCSQAVGRTREEEEDWRKEKTKENLRERTIADGGVFCVGFVAKGFMRRCCGMGLCFFFFGRIGPYVSTIHMFQSHT